MSDQERETTPDRTVLTPEVIAGRAKKAADDAEKAKIATSRAKFPGAWAHFDSIKADKMRSNRLEELLTLSIKREPEYRKDTKKVNNFLRIYLLVPVSVLY